MKISNIALTQGLLREWAAQGYSGGDGYISTNQRAEFYGSRLRIVLDFFKLGEHQTTIFAYYSTSDRDADVNRPVNVGSVVFGETTGLLAFWNGSAWANSVAASAGLRAALLAVNNSLNYPAVAIEAEATARSAAVSVVTDRVVAAEGKSALTINRTGAVGMFPPIQVGDRYLQPTRLTYDLKCEEGYWLDTFLPWRSDKATVWTALLPDEMVIDGQAVRVLEWSYDLRPVRGYYTKSLSPWPPVVVDAAYSDVVVVASAAQVIIYLKSGAPNKPTYIKWNMVYTLDAAKNCNIWRTDRVWEATLAADGSFVQGRMIFASSHVETAIKIDTAWDFAGGFAHGNEEQTRPGIWLVDGAAINPASGKTYKCDKVELFQNSQLFEPGTSSATGFSPKGAAFVEVSKKARWDSDGLNLQHRIKELVAGKAIQFGFFGMAPIQRLDADDGTTQITTDAIRTPSFQLEDVSLLNHPIVETTDT